MNENQHSITVLFNPAPDPQTKTGGPQPTPFCVTACFSNLPAGTDFVKLTKRFYENLMRSLDSAIAECKTGKRDDAAPVDPNAPTGDADPAPVDPNAPTGDADPAAPGRGDDANISENNKPAGEADSDSSNNAAAGEAGGDAGTNAGISEGNDTGNAGSATEGISGTSMEVSDTTESGGAV